MKILITGIAGFIGYHLANLLKNDDIEIVGLDNLNTYYDVSLKLARLKALGIDTSQISFGKNELKSELYNIKFIKGDLSNKGLIQKVFAKEKFTIVCNLAAQAGVRYSIENPDVYVESNINGFFNILEACRINNIEHLVYASSSSIYGLNKKIPFSTEDRVDEPISLYAATKRTNELIAYTYSHLYGMKTTGLRFFTVYGPYGRPDMAYYLFTKAILEDKTIKVFNNGELSRDFTYVGDIVELVKRVLTSEPKLDKDKKYRLYNVGYNSPVNLLDFVETIEKQIGKTAKKEFVEMQKGDVVTTYADSNGIKENFGFVPKTSIKEGIENFVDWYLEFYNIKN